LAFSFKVLAAAAAAAALCAGRRSCQQESQLEGRLLHVQLEGLAATCCSKLLLDRLLLQHFLLMSDSSQ
jgi:hypothetical protein